jgi:CubicO group peptidase (beta-lactamase class C family)
MDSAKLEQIDAYVEENCPKLRSILISRNGYIVFEKYYSGDANYANDIDASTQSITSALIGIALGQGHIKNIDQKMYTFFPEYAPGITDPRRKKISIRHLLTMTPGFIRFGGGSFGDMESDFKRLIEFEPGETHAYNTGASHLLSGIITKSTNMSTLQFADKYLFKPLGIPTPRWATGFGGYNHGGGGLYMRTRDMAKIGYLYLRNGVWDDRQIIPKKWVEESTRKHSSTPFELNSSVEIDIAYGYQWWVSTSPTGYHTFTALGSGGQYIHINPKLNLVTVMTTDSRELGIPHNSKIFFLFIYPSIIE